MKRFLALLLTLLLLLSGIAAGESVSTEEEIEAAEEADADRSVYSIVYNTPGRIYEEPRVEDFTLSSPAIYTGRMDAGKSIYAGTATDDPNKSPSEQIPTSRKLYTANGSTAVDILHVGLQWLIVRKGNVMGYIKRSYILKSTVEAVDPVHTAPFNVQKHAWIATTAKVCPIRATMEEKTGNTILTLNPGTMLSIWKIQDGWGIVNFWKTYAYVDMNDLCDLIPVSPTDEPLNEETPIAAYTSYYKLPSMMTSKDAIKRYENRVWNIRLGCQFISVELAPGQKFDGNGLMGRYNASKGYKKAGVLSEGGTTDGYGGGTCQVASTLYNAVIQCPGLTVTMRRPHGGDGACSYLPCHSDAAVGSSELNFRFTNDYDFTVRLEGHTSDDGALLMLIYRVN